MDPTSLRYKKKLTRIFKQKLRKINDIELQRFIQEKIKQTTESIQKDVCIQSLCSSLERQRDKRECGIEGVSLPLWQQGYQTFPVIVQMCSAEYPLILLFTL